MYNEKELWGYLVKKRLARTSLRALAKEFGAPITHADIYRCLDGKFPRSPAKRFALKLPALAPAPVCPKCGIVHVTKRCPAHRNPSPNWHYLFGMTNEELERRLQ